MSAYWKLKGVSTTLGEIQAWWTASRTPRVFVRHSVKGTTGDRGQEFHSMAEVDDWASENGVTFWEAMETVRAFPFAEKLPIVFSDAPPTSVLKDAIERFTSGEELSGIANEISVDAGLLRCWLIGADPTNKNLQGLRGKKRNATTNRRR
jgi:hypothetical protein